jgi:hypothetical protein
VNIIALGDSAAKLADKFAQYPQYKIYKIKASDDKSENKKTYHMKLKQTPEEYESSCPSLKTFFRNVKGEVLFVVNGAEIISASSLAILQQIINKVSLKVLYIQPDTVILNEVNRLMERSAYNIFQEYARSGLFERIYLVSLPKVETIMGDTPIAIHMQKLYETIASTMHMVNVLQRTEPIHSSNMQSSALSRISTIGLGSLESDSEAEEGQLFFPLKYIKEKKYLYMIEEERLSKDGSLLRKISDKSRKNILEENIKTGFDIHSTEYKRSYVYMVANSSIIQSTDLEIE